MSDGGVTARGGIPGWLVVAGWALTLVVFYLTLGKWVGGAIEGLDPALVSKVPPLASLLQLMAASALTIVWARQRAAREAATDAGEGSEASPSSRRSFLVGGGAIAGGIVASGAATFARISGWATVTGPNITTETPTEAERPRSEWQGARVQRYSELGSTGFQVSDISLGSSRIKGEQGERVARMAIERGVNYFDTAPDYSETGSEMALGRAMKGVRDKMFVATKFCTPHGHLPPNSPVRAYIDAVEASLSRLQTDYVDLVHIHACDQVARLMDPNCHEAFDRLKGQGKARFLGFSSHTPDLELITETAIESGDIDVMMLAYHHGAWPQQAALIERARKAGIGVVAMKTLKGAKHEGLLESRAEADSYTQAAFKWVLSNRNVDCLVISFSQPAHVDEYLYASGKLPTAADHALLREYDRRIAGSYCPPYCNACLESCPEGVPINDVLRHKMYFEDYRDEKTAMGLYAKLGSPAGACASCSAPCQGSCPLGIAIPEATREAHAQLTLG